MKALAGLIATVAGLGFPTAQTTFIPAQGVVSVALAGRHVAWVRAGAQPELYVDGQRVWTAPAVAPPPDVPPKTLVNQTATVAASAQEVAVLRTAAVMKGPPCLQAKPPCLAPSYAERLVGDVWTGPPQGPLRRMLAPAQSCINAFDLSGRLLAEVAGACAWNSPARVRVLSTKSRHVVFDRNVGVVVDEVAIRTPYLAWYQRHAEFSHRMPATDGVVVTDLRSRRVAYHLAPAKLFTNNTPGLDVQRDGVIGLVVDRPPQAPPCATNNDAVAWASRREPRLHFLRARAWSSQLRLARGRFAYIRASSCNTPQAQIAFTRRSGRTRIAATPAGPLEAFDFDGRRLAWATADGIRVTRVR